MKKINKKSIEELIFEKSSIFYEDKNNIKGYCRVDGNGNKFWDTNKTYKFWDEFYKLKIEKDDLNFVGFNFPGFCELCNFNFIEWLINYNGKLEFNNCTFYGDIILNNLKITSNNIIFSDTKFYGNLHFNVNLINSLDIRDSQFFGNLIFDSNNFNSEIKFFNNTYHENILFNGNTFNKILYLNESIFKKDSKFEINEFKDIIFDKSKIEGNFYFNFNDFNVLSLHDSTFFGENKINLINDSTNNINIKKIDLKFITFNENTLFKFFDLRKTTLLHSKIDKVRFEDCIFLEKNGRKILYDEVIGNKFEQIENLYCQLKSNFENKKMWQYAGDFHIGEMEMRRKKLKYEANNKFKNFLMKCFFYLNKNRWSNLIDRILLFFYKWTSYYGESIFWPLFWIFISIITGTLIIDFFLNFGDSLLLVVRAFLFQKDENFNQFNIIVKWILTFIQIISPILISVLIIAIRRKIKR